MHRRFTNSADLVGGVTAGLAILVAGSAQAAIIRSPISATASSTIGPALDGTTFEIGNTIDQSGLSAAFNSGVDDFDTYLSSNPLHSISPGNEWFTPFGITSATVTYNLGQIFSIDRLALWNEDAIGIGTFDILASSDGSNFANIVSGLVPTDNRLNRSYSADVFDLGPSVGAQFIEAQYIRLDIQDCPQSGPEIACAVGEVAFSTNALSPGEPVSKQPAAVPTPALLPSLMGMGVAVLRKRRRVLVGANS